MNELNYMESNHLVMSTMEIELGSDSEYLATNYEEEISLKDYVYHVDSHIKLYVLVDHCVVSVKVSPQDSVGELKQKLCEQLKVETHNYDIIVNNCPVNEDKKVRSIYMYNIRLISNSFLINYIF